MKRVSIIAFVGSLLLVSGISPVNAAIKAGDVCKKSGQISTVKSVKYTCTKSGKKLIWSKGVKTPTPTPTPTPTVVQAKALSIDNLDYEQVYLKSRAEVAKYVASGVSSEGVIDFQVGANVDPWRIEIAKAEVNSAVKLWSSFYKPTSVTIIWYSSKDIPWAKLRYEAAGGNPAWASGFNGCTPKYCGNASASFMGGSKFLFEQGLEFQDQGLWNRATAAHEYTHLAQYGLSNPTNLSLMPWWSVEGGAQFYGEAIGYTPFDSAKQARSGMHTQYTFDSQAHVASLFPAQTLKSLFLKNDPAITKTLMKSIEVSSNSQGALGLSYLLGSYATEVLVAVYGHEKMAKFYSAFATSTNYESNFSNIFGITLDTFYTKLTPYLVSMSAELK
jgi:hypothetical protein